MQTRKQILIVDDHDRVRQGLTFCLKATDDLAPAGEAQTGREAIDLCIETQPDIILMDLVMPEMDGIEAIQAIHNRYPHIIIIALTCADSTTESARAALEAGAAQCLDKLAPLQTIVSFIRSTTANRVTSQSRIQSLS